MNSRTKAQRAAHRAMTALCADARCLHCGGRPSEPAHWPTHRGMGGGKAGWSIEEIVPLCHADHMALDRQNGVSEAATAYSVRVLASVVAKAPAWRRRQNLKGAS
jgi:hypothetical protein